MFDYLIGVTPDGRLSADGGIAQRWEHSADHRRWTFDLRRGVRFHNGDGLTLADVKFSLKRAMSKRSTTGYAGPLRDLIQDIETPAPDRVVIVAKDPTLIFPPHLSPRAVSPLHSRLLRLPPADLAGRAPRGHRVRHRRDRAQACPERLRTSRARFPVRR
jgi:MarR-like DNA-binding transcriptional regulator SgrR of sgrS sRNA